MISNAPYHDCSMTTPKVSLCLANGITNGGVTTWAVSLSQRLNQQGVCTRILSHKPVEGSSRFATEFLSETVECPGDANTQNINAAISFLPKYSEECEGVFIPNWSWGTWSAVALLSMHQQSNIRVIGIAHADDGHYVTLLCYYERIIHKFIAVSTEIYDQLLKLLPQRVEDIVLLSCPVATPAEIRDRDSKDNILTIAYVGRIEQWQKRILDLKDLVEHLERGPGKYHFIIAGDGYSLPELKRHFESHDYSNSTIEFLGLVQPAQVKDIWDRADTSVMFSDYEGLSISMLESMAHGCVPIVTEVSGVKETIKQGETGFTVSIGDMLAMANWLQILQADRKLLGRISTKCASHICAKHQIIDYDRKFLSLLNQAWLEAPSRWPCTQPIMPPPAAVERPDSPQVIEHRNQMIYRRVIKKFKKIFA